MRKVILCLAVSFDGLIEGPNGELDWIVFGKDGGSALTSFIEEIDTVLYGRISYEMWGNPEITDASSEFGKDFYGKLASMDRYVFSTTRDMFDGSPTVVTDDAEHLVAHLKSQPGKNIWLYGGASLITTFMNEGLVDELRLAIMPSIIGEGKPLFQNIRNRTDLTLVSVQPSESGVLDVTYKTKRPENDAA